MNTCVEQAFFKHYNAVRARRSCFAPFAKGGYGGFALRVMPGQEQEQKQIPLHPPFAKGENKHPLEERYARRAVGMCGRVDA